MYAVCKRLNLDCRLHKSQLPEAVANICIAVAVGKAGVTDSFVDNSSQLMIFLP